MGLPFQVTILYEKMILPIVMYGAPVLRMQCASVQPGYPQLQQLIANMWETMYHAHGCGLAAPQVNVPIRLFIVEEQGVFINAAILEYAAELCLEEEGCLSMPGLAELVPRPSWVRVRYMDEHFREQEKVFSGEAARIVQHEYDHTNGILYLDHLKLKRGR